MKFHPISNIFPMMSDSEFKELKEDIQKNGLIEPIRVYQDSIIDGRNRFNACMELGVFDTDRSPLWQGIFEDL